MRRKLRALFLSSRPVVLPSVFSNITLGWVLGGGCLFSGGRMEELILLLAAGIGFYLFGMWGNDVADSPWDARFRPERPVPSGMISRGMLAGCACAALVAGLCLVPQTAFPYACLLAACIIIYTVLHKRWPGAVIFMGLCRGLLVLTAAAAAVGSWSFPALPMAQISSLLYPAVLVSVIYIGGVTLWARDEARFPERISQVGFLLSLLPVLDAFWLSLAGMWSGALICGGLYVVARILRRMGAGAS